jgi:hypothetical protein
LAAWSCGSELHLKHEYHQLNTPITHEAHDIHPERNRLIDFAKLPAVSPRRGTWEMPLLSLLLVATIWAVCFHFPVVWMATGIGEADKPYLDLRSLLAAGEAAQAGLDPYASNPKDPYHRPHLYTEWWLAGGALGLTLADTLWLGTVLIGLTLVSTVLLTRPANAWEAGSLVLFLVSPAMLLAVARANHDLVVFVLMGAALACLRTTRLTLRALGIVLLAVAAVLKYFPLAAILLLFEARTRREMLGWSLLYGLVLVLAWPSLEPGLRAAVRNQPAPDWLYAFGAPVLFRDFHLPVPGGLIAAALLLAIVAGRLVFKPVPDSAPATASRDDEREFVCGAVMVAGCFLHGSSYVYKMIFAAWLLPWLWRTAPVKQSRWFIFALLIAVLWLEGFMAVVINLSVTFSIWTTVTGERVLAVTLLASQLLTWALAISLGRSLLIYLQRQLHRLGFLRA